jgi:hypothetical protein
MADVDLGKPNRRMIEMLFRDLLRSNHGGYDGADSDPLWVKFRRLDDAAEALEQKLLNNPKLRKLQKAAQLARSAALAKDRERTSEVRTLHQRYLANGVSPQLIKDLNALLNKYAKAQR